MKIKDAIKPCPNCDSRNIEIFNIFTISDYGLEIMGTAEFCDAICLDCDTVYPFTRLYDSYDEYKELNCIET